MWRYISRPPVLATSSMWCAKRRRQATARSRKPALASSPLAYIFVDGNSGTGNCIQFFQRFLRTNPSEFLGFIVQNHLDGEFRKSLTCHSRPIIVQCLNQLTECAPHSLYPPLPNTDTASRRRSHPVLHLYLHLSHQWRVPE